MRILIAVLAALAVCACNWVITKTPLFSAADEAGAPRLKSGVWSAGSSSDCKFDETQPLTDWPDCAGRLVIKGGRWTTLDKKDGRWSLTTQHVVLAGGSPLILQTPPDTDGKTDETGYSYYGLAATTRDRNGRITGFVIWPVLCGAPGKSDAEHPAHPFPGLTMHTNDSDCTTTSKDALRDAADASRLWADTPMTAHWVRAGDR